MQQYIEDLFDTIKNGNMTTTYKMAWIRAITETCLLNPTTDELSLDDIATKMFEYYWNQSIFFDLVQSVNSQKKPILHMIVMEQIEIYRKQHGQQPMSFHKVANKVTVDTKRIIREMNKNVMHCFGNVSGKTHDFYSIDMKKHTVTIHRADLIREFSSILFTAINARWSILLQEVNTCPRISKKISSTTIGGDIKRGDLKKFHKLLDVENSGRVCFHTGLPIPKGEESVDHVIPWSYMFSDDVWNLVWTSKSYNSSKSNSIPSEATIRKLEQRNARLFFLIWASGDAPTGMVRQIDELKLANESNLIKKHWIGCQ